jgi:hypothetical protein
MILSNAPESTAYYFQIDARVEETVFLRYNFSVFKNEIIIIEDKKLIGHIAD